MAIVECRLSHPDDTAGPDQGREAIIVAWDFNRIDGKQVAKSHFSEALRSQGPKWPLFSLLRRYISHVFFYASRCHLKLQRRVEA